MTPPPPAPPPTLKRQRLGGFASRQHRFLSAPFGEDGDPMLDEVGRVSVNFHPRQPVAKNTAVRQGTLRAHAGAEIAKTTLQAEHLPQSLHITARQRQFPHSRTNRPSLAGV